MRERERERERCINVLSGNNALLKERKKKSSHWQYSEFENKIPYTTSKDSRQEWAVQHPISIKFTVPAFYQIIAFIHSRSNLHTGYKKKKKKKKIHVE